MTARGEPWHQEGDGVSAKHYNTIEEEARRTRLSVRTIERRCRDGQFPFIRCGRRKLFDPDLTDEYLARSAYRGRAAEMAERAAAA